MNTFLDTKASGSSRISTGWRAWQLLVESARKKDREFSAQEYKRKLMVIVNAMDEPMAKEGIGVLGDLKDMESKIEQRDIEERLAKLNHTLDYEIDLEAI